LARAADALAFLDVSSVRPQAAQQQRQLPRLVDRHGPPAPGAAAPPPRERAAFVPRPGELREC
jgi:hypothetical protein